MIFLNTGSSRANVSASLTDSNQEEKILKKSDQSFHFYRSLVSLLSPERDKRVLISFAIHLLVVFESIMFRRFFSPLTLLLAPAAGFQGTAFVARSPSLGQSRACSSSALSMSTIAVVGASGLTASECVYQALQNGDNVVGLTR